jgi:hypothetical protein
MAVIVPATLAQFADLVAEDIQDIFVKRREQKKPLMGEVFNVRNSKSYYNKDSSVLGGEKAKFIGDNASVVYDAPIQGYDKTYTSKKYGTGMKISDHLWKFGIEFRRITTLVETMMDEVDEKTEDDAFDMLNNGYATSYTDGDGQTVTTSGGNAAAFFSNAQTREDGGTSWNNIVYDGTTYNMDFEYDALKALRRTAALVKTGRGQVMGVQPDVMVCKYGSSVHSRYEELMGALNRGNIPGGNENDGAAKVGLPKLITSKYLDNDAYWFSFDSSMKGDKYGLQWVWAFQPTLDAPELDYDTDLYKRKVTMFYDRGANDMRNTFASKGDNTTP